MAINRPQRDHKNNTLLYRGYNLHSAYDPIKEAHTIVDSQISIKNPQYIIVIEPAVGYLIMVARQKYPKAKIIAIHVDYTLFSSNRWRGDVWWHPRTPLSLEIFLNQQMDILGAPRVAIITLPSIKKIEPNRVKAIHNQIGIILQQIRAQISTIGAFGMRWINNSIINFLSINTLRSIPSPAPVIVIVGSGASIINQIDSLRYLYQNNRVSLWALPSAVPFLLHHNIIPQVVISTDSGYWATWHYRSSSAERLSTNSHHTLHWLIPISAARGLYNYNVNLSLFQQNFGIESMLASKIWAHAPLIPECGTVAGTALSLAYLLQASWVILAGIDLAYTKHNLHCYPHSFENWYCGHAHRTHPWNSVELERWLKARRVSSDPTIRISHQHSLYRTMLRSLISQYHNITIGSIGYPSFGSLIPNYTMSELRKITLSVKNSASKRQFNQSQPLAIPSRQERIAHLKSIHTSVHNILAQKEMGNISAQLKEIILALGMHELYQLPPPKDSQFNHRWNSTAKRILNRFIAILDKYLA